MHVGLDAPQPAGATTDDEVVDSADIGSADQDIELIVRRNNDPTLSACGMQLEIRDQSKGKCVKRFATIGGLVRIQGEIFGLTTAHSVLPEDFNVSPCGSDSEVITDDGNSSAESDSEVSLSPAEVECKLPFDPEVLLSREDGECVSGVTSSSYRVGSSPQTRAIGWSRLQNPTLDCYSFAGRASTTGNTRMAYPTGSYSDVALVKLGLENISLYNRYSLNNTMASTTIEINEIEKDPAPGSVEILCSATASIKGWLLQDPSVFMQRGGVFNTKKIQLTTALGGLDYFTCSLQVLKLSIIYNEMCSKMNYCFSSLIIISKRLFWFVGRTWTVSVRLRSSSLRR